MNDSEAQAAQAALFETFCTATTSHQIFDIYKQICNEFSIRPSVINDFFPKLMKIFNSWKAKNLWKILIARTGQSVYEKGNVCSGTRVLIVGAGPCGLRTAIEAQMLGAKVVVIEKRDQISRNNVLRLWPFVITDLRNLAAKTFYGKFCSGSINHISTRQLQCILLKVALLLGVEIHDCVSFENLIEPVDGCGWKASVIPSNHVVSCYEFDVLIGAGGTQFILQDFKRKELRGKLAIAITANFVNTKTEAEANAEEISGVARPFKQAFFKDLYQKTNIDLENIVYYKDETHYFVMTAKKQSLIQEGVLKTNYSQSAKLLASANVDKAKLYDYARRAAEYSTLYKMKDLTFATNNYGKPDVAIFDFTSMYAAENSCLAKVRRGCRLLECVVGDSLLEPFWPTGSGIARGFLSSMDAAYAIKLWSDQRNDILHVLAQRESIYRLLNQTTYENLRRDINSYTLDPMTRYPNLNLNAVKNFQVVHLLNTDDSAALEDMDKISVVEPLEVVEVPICTNDTCSFIEYGDVKDSIDSKMEDSDMCDKYRSYPEPITIDTLKLESAVREIDVKDFDENISNRHIAEEVDYNILKPEVNYNILRSESNFIEKIPEFTECIKNIPELLPLNNLSMESTFKEEVPKITEDFHSIPDKIQFNNLDLESSFKEEISEIIEKICIPDEIQINNLGLESTSKEQIPQLVEIVHISEEQLAVEEKGSELIELSDLSEHILSVDEEVISPTDTSSHNAKINISQRIKDMMVVSAKPVAFLAFTMCLAYYMWK